MLNKSVMLFVVELAAGVGQRAASHCFPDSEGLVDVFSSAEARISGLDSPFLGLEEERGWEP
jgi:hypothetical protein